MKCINHESPDTVGKPFELARVLYKSGHTLPNGLEISFTIGRINEKAK